MSWFIHTLAPPALARPDPATGRRVLRHDALGQLGSDLRQLELQTEQLQGVMDATEEGLGNIVDADMARASAEQTAVQVRQQLATQTLGIANEAPQVLLGLFQ